MIESSDVLYGISVLLRTGGLNMFAPLLAAMLGVPYLPLQRFGPEFV